MDRLTSLFKALSDETRIRILVLLSKEKLCVCQIYRIMDQSQPKISKHLAKLKNIGLIKDEKQEQFVYYYLNKDNRMLQDLLNEIVLNLEQYPIIKNDLNKLKNAANYITDK